MQMRLDHCCGALALILFPWTAIAESPLPRHQPTVVYEGRSTISAHPYYQRIEARGGQVPPVSAPKGSTTVTSIEDRLPISPTQLRIGKPDMKVIDGLVSPLFVMGMDDLSLRWFREAAPGLQSLGARGLVIQASSESDWLALKERALVAGIDLMLMEGDALAQGYGVSTYPMVFVGPDVEGWGANE